MGWILRARGEYSIITVIHYLLEYVQSFQLDFNHVVFVGSEDALFIFDSYTIFENFVLLLVSLQQLNMCSGVELYC